MVREDVIQALGGPEVPMLSNPIEDYLRALANDIALPYTAVAVCTLRADEAAPAILAVLTKAGEGAELSDAEANLLLRGLHILGGARNPAAWPSLLRLLRRSSEDLDMLLGDTITMTLPQIAAGVFDGDAASLFDVVMNAEVDEFARESMLGAATFLAWDGRIDRSLMRDFLVRFGTEGQVADRDVTWIGWLEAIALLGLRDLAPLVHRAWDEGRMPERVLTRADFEDDLRAAEQAPNEFERLKPHNLGYIEDVLASLELANTAPGDDEADIEDMRQAMDGPPEPIRNPLRGVGRNDPCPCGSGKKAKKCCLATG